MMVLYRSKTVSPLEADPTKYRSGMLSVLEANPTKYRSQVVSTLLEATWAPSMASLWAWFKLNEGAGTPIIDYSLTAINGAVVNESFNPPTQAQIDAFWNTLPGFGSGVFTSGTGPLVRRATAGRDTTYCSLVAFIRIRSDAGNLNPRKAVALGESSTGNMIHVGWYHDVVFGVPHDYWTLSLNTGNYISVTEVTFDAWYCVYAFAQRNSTNSGLSIRKSGDPDWTVIRSGDTVNNNSALEGTIYLCGTGALNVSAGDALCYADSIPSGLISVTAATEIYNNLKSRYGMS